MLKPLHALHAPYSQRRAEPTLTAPHNCICPTSAQVQARPQVQGHHYNGDVECIVLLPNASCCSHQSARIVNSRAVITLFPRGSLSTSKAQDKCINASAALYLIKMKGSIFQILSCKKHSYSLPLYNCFTGAHKRPAKTLGERIHWRGFQEPLLINNGGSGKENHHSLQSGQPPGFI